MFKSILSKIIGTQFKLNVISGVLTSAITFVLNIVKYPVFLYFMGIEMYGVWLILSTVLSFAQLGLSGVTVGVVKLLAEEYSNNNIESIEKYITTALFGLFLLGVILLGASFCFGSDIVRLIGLTGVNSKLGMKYLPYMAMLSMYIFSYEIINATLSGLGRIDIANYSQAFLQLVPLLIAVLLLMSGIHALTSMVVAHSFAYIFISILNIYRIKKLVKLKIISFSNLSYRHLLKLFKYSGSLFVSSVVSMLFFPYSKIIVSSQLGVSSVPLYEIAYKASYQVQTAFTMGLRALMPGISRLSVKSIKSDALKIDNIKALSNRITLYGGTLTCLSAFILAELIFKIWLSNNYHPEIVEIFRVLLAGILSCIVCLVPYYELIGTGRLTIVVIYHCIAPIVSVSMILILTIFSNITLFRIALSNSVGLIAGSLFLMFSIRYLKTNEKEM